MGWPDQSNLFLWTFKTFLAKTQIPIVWTAHTCFTPHCTIWFFSDAQLPDTLRVVYTNLARASQFWTFWYRILDGPSGGRDISGNPERTTRQTVSVDERTTPYNLPTTVDRYRGKATNNNSKYKDKDKDKYKDKDNDSLQPAHRGGQIPR